MKVAEDFARIWMAAELGVPVVKYDDNKKPGMHDLNINYQDGRKGAVEVTTATDGTTLASLKMLEPNVWTPESRLTGNWIVDFVRGQKIPKDFYERLVQLLRAAEGRGYTNAREISRAYAGNLKELSISAIDLLTLDGQGKLMLQFELDLDGMAGCVPGDGDGLLDWFEDWITVPSRADNLAKLAKSGADESHLFLVVPYPSDAPWVVNGSLVQDSPPLPTRPPRLPREITHVWLASSWNTPKGLRWCPRAGWKTFEKTETIADEGQK